MLEVQLPHPKPKTIRDEVAEIFADSLLQLTVRGFRPDERLSAERAIDVQVSFGGDVKAKRVSK